MASVPQEFVTVDMRGLKPALIERSRVDRVSVSSLVRAFVKSGLGQEGAVEVGMPSRHPEPIPKVRLSVRISAAEARLIVNGAGEAGLSRAAFLAELIARAPRGVTSAARQEQLAALAASNAELATLSRYVRHLAALLSQGSNRAAQEYRGTLETIAVDVRRHLSASSAVLADVRSRRTPIGVTQRSSPNTNEVSHDRT